MKIKPTSESPTVVLDSETGILEINGRSFPEDAEKFYAPVLQWLEDYARNPLPETSIKINLEYFNSSSLKQIVKTLIILEGMASAENKVKVIWCYQEGDELIEMKGEEIKSIVDLPFEFCMV